VRFFRLPIFFPTDLLGSFITPDRRAPELSLHSRPCFDFNSVFCARSLAQFPPVTLPRETFLTPNEPSLLIEDLYPGYHTSVFPFFLFGNDRFLLHFPLIYLPLSFAVKILHTLARWKASPALAKFCPFPILNNLRKKMVIVSISP